MLKVPKLDDLSYEQIIQRAVSRVPAMTDEWTDFNSHDPGITVLQTYAWLTDMLNYYLNATGDVHVEKYLKLLGIEPRPARAARGYLVLDGEAEGLRIPAGTRFLADDIPFETEEDYQGTVNRFCSFISETDGAAADLTAFAGTDGEYAAAFARDFRESSVLYLGFEKPLGNGDRLYVSVEKNDRRNPFHEDFSLCGLDWEAWDGDGWRGADVEDGTCGFLKSGVICVKDVCRMEPMRHPAGMAQAYYLRCVLKEDAYDELPGVGMIYVNPLDVVQKKTVCRKGEILPELHIGTTDGCAGQELLFDYPDIYHFSLALETAEGIFEYWDCTEHLDQAGYRDRVFAFDGDVRTVRFGDGIHGAVPPQKCPVYVTGLTLSLYEHGNVLAGRICAPDDEESLPCRVYNPEPAAGGRSRETVREMIARMEEELFAQQRMASAADYEEIIGRTPGLMIEKVHVIPGRIYGNITGRVRGDGEVAVVVKPYSREKKARLSSAYRKRIENYMEPYRLLNTKVTVEEPSYVGITVHGRISLRDDTPGVKKQVEACLRDLIDYDRVKEPFGAAVSCGKLFSALEALDAVERVRELTLERTGSAAVKNEKGDVLLREDALGYLEGIDLEFSQTDR